MEGKTKTRERRRAERTASDAVNVTLHDVGSSRPTVVRGQVIDVSDRGIGVVTRDKIQERTYVTLRVEPWDWSGNATTRYCAQSGAKYMVGLELSPGTRKPVQVKHSADPLKNDS
jgi:hypothetical protein